MVELLTKKRYSYDGSSTQEAENVYFKKITLYKRGDRVWNPPEKRQKIVFYSSEKNDILEAKMHLSKRNPKVVRKIP